MVTTNSNKNTHFALEISSFFDVKIKNEYFSDNPAFLGATGLQSEYKFHDRKITIFSNLWYKSGSVLKKRRQYQLYQQFATSVVCTELFQWYTNSTWPQVGQ